VSGVPELATQSVHGAHGRAELGYEGADTYMGHQELMGTIPGVPEDQLMREVRDAILDALVARGHRVEAFLPPSPMLLVDGLVVVHDNMETDPGRNINVTGAHDLMPLERIVEIGEIVRSVVKVSRVIVVMGVGYDAGAIARHIVRGPQDTVGVDSPGLGVYTERYRVRHLGIGVDIRRQLASIAKAAGLDVYLLGKAADVVECEGAVGSPDVVTGEVLRKTLETLPRLERGLIVANIQEGDLAGHEQDAARWADVLQQVDATVPMILDLLHGEDLLLVVADHGNDPSAGHSQHTRELTPVLVAGPGVMPVALGKRATLADAAATAAEHLEIHRPKDGESFYPLLYGVEGERRGRREDQPHGVTTP
jgi:phosphopentomutase